MQPCFDQISRILSRAPPLALFLFPADDGRWTSLLTILAQHASIIERELTDERGCKRMRDYLETPQSLFPASSGRTPVEALEALNALLARIPDSSIGAWSNQVIATYGAIRALRGKSTLELPLVRYTEPSA